MGTRTWTLLEEHGPPAFRRDHSCPTIPHSQELPHYCVETRGANLLCLLGGDPAATPSSAVFLSPRLILGWTKKSNWVVSPIPVPPGRRLSLSHPDTLLACMPKPGLARPPLIWAPLHSTSSPEKEAFKKRAKLQQENSEETDENEAEEVRTTPEPSWSHVYPCVPAGVGGPHQHLPIGWSGVSAFIDPCTS